MDKLKLEFDNLFNKDVTQYQLRDMIFILKDERLNRMIGGTGQIR